MVNVLIKSIFAPLRVVNREDVKGRLQASVAAVLATAILGSIIAPVVYSCVSKSKFEIRLNIWSMFIELSVSMVTWLAVCVLFWSLAKAFNKELTFRQVVSTWGLSYIPNFLCVVIYNLILIFPGIHNGSGFIAFTICTLFIMLLVWKAIFYFMLMRFVINTTLREIAIITVISAAVFTFLMIMGARVGIKVPML